MACHYGLLTRGFSLSEPFNRASSKTKPVRLYYLLIYVLCMCSRARMHAHTCVRACGQDRHTKHTCGDQRTTFGSRFSPSIMGSQGINSGQWEASLPTEPSADPTWLLKCLYMVLLQSEQCRVPRLKWQRLASRTGLVKCPSVHCREAPLSSRHSEDLCSTLAFAVISTKEQTKISHPHMLATAGQESQLPSCVWQTIPGSSLGDFELVMKTW